MHFLPVIPGTEPGARWPSTLKQKWRRMNPSTQQSKRRNCMFDYLIVGAGFAGSVLAERLASQANKKVLILDKRDHIAGNAFDYYNNDGILIHKYGPHIFHTNSKDVFNYLDQFTAWRPR